MAFQVHTVTFCYTLSYPGLQLEISMCSFYFLLTKSDKLFQIIYLTMMWLMWLEEIQEGLYPVQSRRLVKECCHGEALLHGMPFCRSVGVAISSGSVMMENWNHWLPWGIAVLFPGSLVLWSDSTSHACLHQLKNLLFLSECN